MRKIKKMFYLKIFSVLFSCKIFPYRFDLLIPCILLLDLEIKIQLFIVIIEFRLTDSQGCNVDLDFGMFPILNKCIIKNALFNTTLHDCPELCLLLEMSQYWVGWDQAVAASTASLCRWRTGGGQVPCAWQHLIIPMQHSHTGDPSCHSRVLIHQCHSVNTDRWEWEYYEHVTPSSHHCAVQGESDKPDWVIISQTNEALRCRHSNMTMTNGNFPALGSVQLLPFLTLAVPCSGDLRLGS